MKLTKQMLTEMVKEVIQEQVKKQNKNDEVFAKLQTMSVGSLNKLMKNIQDIVRQKTDKQVGASKKTLEQKFFSESLPVLKKNIRELLKAPLIEKEYNTMLTNIINRLSYWANRTTVKSMPKKLKILVDALEALKNLDLGLMHPSFMNATTLSGKQVWGTVDDWEDDEEVEHSSAEVQRERKSLIKRIKELLETV